MADTCYNLLQFMGNQKVMKQIAEWKKALDSFQPTPEDPHCMRAIREVFYSEAPSDVEIDFGSKWVHQDDASMDVEDGMLGFASAWAPPNELHKRMACLLFDLDNHVVVRNQYNIELATVGVAYAAPYDSENAYLLDVEVELDDGYDETADAEDAAYEELEEQELKILNFLMDDMEGTVRTIKKHMPKLQIDWDDYS